MGFHVFGVSFGTPDERHRSGRMRRYPVSVVLSALRIVYDIGAKKTGEVLGISPLIVEEWRRKRFLPKTGRYTFPKMLALVTLARRYYLCSRIAPVTALKWAVARTPSMNWITVKIYLYFEAMPTVPGYPLYADRVANEKAERYGLGLRNYGSVFGVDHPHIPAEVRPSPQASRSRSEPQRQTRQLGRKFVREGQATSLLPSRKYNLL